MKTVTVSKRKKINKDVSDTYEEFKEFEGEQYTGMKVGRHHKWYYDKGEWKEKKISPDQWEFTYAVKKEGLEKPLKDQGFLLTLNITGGLLLIRMFENWMLTAIQQQ